MAGRTTGAEMLPLSSRRGSLLIFRPYSYIPKGKRRTPPRSYRFPPRGRGPSGPHLPRGEVLFLLQGKTVDPGADGRELQPRDLPVDLLGDRVDLSPEGSPLLDKELHAERLVGEAHVHDGRRVAFRGGQVDESPLRQNVDRPPIPHPVFLYEGPDGADRSGHPLQGGDVDLHVEMSGIAHDDSVLHFP